jgi:hypothetical protein
LGGVSCSYLLWFFFICVIAGNPRGESAMGAATGAIYSLVCGSILGSIVGLAFAVRRVMQRGMDTWLPRTWIGILLGLPVGLVGALRSLHSHLGTAHWTNIPREQWLLLLTLTAAASTLGGILSTVIVGWWKGRSSRLRPERRKGDRLTR